jgi:hypothetical protein
MESIQKIVTKVGRTSYLVLVREKGCPVKSAAFINGIFLKLTEAKPGEYEGACLNPKEISPA